MSPEFGRAQVMLVCVELVWGWSVSVCLTVCVNGCTYFSSAQDELSVSPTSRFLILTSEGGRGPEGAQRALIQTHRHTAGRLTDQPRYFTCTTYTQTGTCLYSCAHFYTHTQWFSHQIRRRMMCLTSLKQVHVRNKMASTEDGLIMPP